MVSLINIFVSQHMLKFELYSTGSFQELNKNEEGAAEIQITEVTSVLRVTLNSCENRFCTPIPLFLCLTFSGCT